MYRCYISVFREGFVIQVHVTAEESIKLRHGELREAIARRVEKTLVDEPGSKRRDLLRGLLEHLRHFSSLLGVGPELRHSPHVPTFLDRRSLDSGPEEALVELRFDEVLRRGGILSRDCGTLRDVPDGTPELLDEVGVALSVVKNQLTAAWSKMTP